MRMVLYLAAIAALAWAGYWMYATHRPVTTQAPNELTGTARSFTPGGADPATTMQNAHGAANRIEDDGFKRAADIDSKTAP